MTAKAIEFPLDEGKLIVFEGPDGIGKSHLAEKTCDWLRSRGVKALLVSFPGDAEYTLGRLVYDLHHFHNERFHIPKINPLSLQILHVAAHIDEINRAVRPAINDGTWVVLNRFWWSTWVYGMLNGVNQKSLDLIIEAERNYWANLLPDAIFLLRRQGAIRDEHGPDAFARLSALYKELSNREQTSGVVHEVENSELGASLESIVTVLRQLVRR